MRYMSPFMVIVEWFGFESRPFDTSETAGFEGRRKYFVWHSETAEMDPTVGREFQSAGKGSRQGRIRNFKD